MAFGSRSWNRRYTPRTLDLADIYKHYAVTHSDVEISKSPPYIAKTSKQLY